jgi:hypothetical protein
MIYDMHGKYMEGLEKEQRNELDQIASGIKDIAGRHGLQIFSCSEDIDLASIGIKQGACIDGVLISQLFGSDATSSKDKNQRESCGCVESADMGIYNTCLFRCAYCYANFNEGMIESNYQKHYPDSPSLLGKYAGGVEIQMSLHKKKKCSSCQQNLF